MLGGGGGGGGSPRERDGQWPRRPSFPPDQSIFHCPSF